MIFFKPALCLFLAGIMLGPREETTEGFEAQMGTNHFGHFLLTHLLMPRLKEAGTAARKARIVNTSSWAHYAGAWLDFEDIHCKYVILIICGLRR